MSYSHRTRGRGSMGGRGARGSAKKLHWKSLREVIEETIAEWEGPPFFTLDGLIDHIHGLYWKRARKHGHYKGAGIYDIRRRLRSSVAAILRGWDFERRAYCRLQPRRDRFGFLLEKPKSYWSFPDCHLPASAIAKTNRLNNLNQLEGEEE